MILAVILLVPDSSGGAVLKIATLAPEGAFEVTQMRAAAKQIQARTQDRVKFKFFTGGVMGNDQGVLRKIRINQLQGGAVSTGTLANHFPDNQIYSLPMMFQSLEEVDYVRERMDPLQIKGYEESGFIIFGIAEGGFAYIMSSNPVASLYDLQKQKVWIPDNDKSALEAIKAFNISPITLSVADVRTGLQTGLLNTIAIPPAYAILLHWHTQVKHITQMPLIYTAGILAIAKKAFYKIGSQDRLIIRNLMGHAFRTIDQFNRKQNSDAIAALKNFGIKFITPDSQAVQEFKEKSKRVAQDLVDKGILSQSAVNTLNRHLKSFRANPGQ